MTQNRVATRDMLLRLWCVGMLLCAVVTVGAQNPNDLAASVVRITTPDRQGSGVVVAIEGDAAVILTLSHVLAGAQRYNVVFAGAPERGSFEATAADVAGVQMADQVYGLAAFRVKGAIPAGVRAARFEATQALERGDGVLYWGYPNRSTTVLRVNMSVSGIDGTNFVTDRALGEGASGGAIEKDGRVVGIASARDAQFTYGVTSLVAASALKGWRITVAPEPPDPGPVTGRPPVTTQPPGGITDIRLEIAPDALFALTQNSCRLPIAVNIGGTTANPTSYPATIRNVPLGPQNYQITGQIPCSLWPSPCPVAGRGTITVDRSGTYALQIQQASDGRTCQITLVKP